MVGKNTKGSWHTESWRPSSFGPRNIGTGHKYTPSQNNVKVKESTISQDQNKKIINWDDPWAVELEIQNAFLTDDFSSFKELSDARIKQLIRDPQEAARIINGKNGIVTPEKQAAQGMVDSSKPTESYVSYKRNMQKQDTAKPADYPEFTELPRSNYYPLAYANGVYTPRLGNNSLNYSNTRDVSNYPTKNGLFEDGQYPFEAYEGMGNVEFVPMYNPHYPRERLFSRPEDYYPNPFEKRRYDVDIQRYPDMTETQRKLRDTAEVLGLGLGGIGLVGYIRGQQAQERQRQSQTQILDQIEPESVNEDIPQVEPTLEQQYAAQDIPSFSARIDNLFDLYQRQEQLIKDRAAYEAYLRAQEMGQRIATGTGYAPELKEDNFEFPQNPPEVGSNIKTAGLESPDGGKVPQELNRLSGVKPKVIKDTSNGPVVLNEPNHRKTRDVQNSPIAPEQAAASQMVNQYAGIPVEVIRAKNFGYNQPPLNHATDAIWDRVRKAGLSSPEQAIRSGLFTPDEVRYITENDLWRYR